MGDGLALGRTVAVTVRGFDGFQRRDIQLDFAQNPPRVAVLCPSRGRAYRCDADRRTLDRIDHY